MSLLYCRDKSSTGRKVKFIFARTAFYKLLSLISFYCRISN